MSRSVARGGRWAVAATFGATAATAGACGARTALPIGEPDPYVFVAEANDRGSGGGASEAPREPCVVASDCKANLEPCRPATCLEGFCSPGKPKICDDGDPCTIDGCVATSGACTHQPVTLDVDGDGFRGPAPGKKPGDPDACGDDCDDTSAAAFPGNAETCDGVDNDCNGVVDDDAKFVPVSGPPVLVSQAELESAEAGGLAYGAKGKGYLAAFTGQTQAESTVYVRAISASGTPGAPPVSVNVAGGDGFGGPMAFTGDRYGLAWHDRREGDYEIYFNTLAPDGSKLGPDVRVSVADGFSVNPTIAWSGSSFYVLWQDDREDPSHSSFRVFARRIGLGGELLGDEVALTDEPSAEAPSIAASSQAVGFAYRAGDSQASSVRFRTIDIDGTKASTPTLVTTKEANYESPQAVWNGTGFVVVFGEKLPFRVFGATLTASGALDLAPTQLSPPGAPSRAPAVLPLGDRVIVAYGRQGDLGYDLYTRAFSKALVPLGDPQQITTSPGDDLANTLAFGPAGDVGVLFTGRVLGPQGLQKAAFFTRLQCAAGP